MFKYFSNEFILTSYFIFRHLFFKWKCDNTHFKKTENSKLAAKMLLTCFSRLRKFRSFDIQSFKVYKSSDSDT